MNTETCGTDHVLYHLLSVANENGYIPNGKSIAGSKCELKIRIWKYD